EHSEDAVQVGDRPFAVLDVEDVARGIGASIDDRVGEFFLASLLPGADAVDRRGIAGPAYRDIQDPLAASFAARLARLRRLGNLAQEELHEQDVLLLRVLGLLADGRIDVEEDADHRARMLGYDEMHGAISPPRERTVGDVRQQCKPAPAEFRYPEDAADNPGPEKISGT